MRLMTAALLISFMIIVIAPSAHADETVMIQVNHGMLLKVSNVERVVVAAPDVADVNIITRTQLMLVAKKVGETTISVWDARGYTAYRVVITGAPSTDIIKALSEVLREPSVVVKVVGDAIVLEGSVKTSADKARAESIASSFGRKVINVLTVEQVAPPPPSASQTFVAQVQEVLRGFAVTVKAVRDVVVIEGTVANVAELVKLEILAKELKGVVLLVRVREPRQYRVATTFVEINRQALQQMGVDWGGAVTGGNVLQPGVFHFGFFDLNNPVTPIQTLLARLRLLESSGAARTLANPGAVVIEGRPGALLVGGEVPFPVLDANGRVTFEFKKFGIRIEYCVNSILKKTGEQLECVRDQPFTSGDGATMMDLRTEVSTLDFSNAIVASGFLIPTIKKREVQTTVIMRPGEFLLLGGLIQRDTTVNVQKVPFLGDIPILGVLFRSTQFQRGETELVIFVSPNMIAPTPQAPQVPAEPSSPLPPPSTSP